MNDKDAVGSDDEDGSRVGDRSWLFAEDRPRAYSRPKSIVGGKRKRDNIGVFFWLLLFWRRGVSETKPLCRRHRSEQPRTTKDGRKPQKKNAHLPFKCVTVLILGLTSRRVPSGHSLLKIGWRHVISSASSYHFSFRNAFLLKSMWFFVGSCTEEWRRLFLFFLKKVLRHYEDRKKEGGRTTKYNYIHYGNKFIKASEEE